MTNDERLAKVKNIVDTLKIVDPTGMQPELGDLIVFDAICDRIHLIEMKLDALINYTKSKEEKTNEH